MMLNKTIFNEIFNEVEKFKVIDTHEHLLWTEDHRVNGDDDVLSEYLLHYLKSDIISSGLKIQDFNRVIDSKEDIRERWKIVEPSWEASRCTGYGCALDIAI